MFQSSISRFRALLERADILGDPPAPPAPHIHRRPLRWERARRGGAVSTRPAHCLSPVRGRDGRAREHIER